MKKAIKKICSIFPPSAREYCEMVFKSASDNQLRLWRSNKNRFRSYSQLKKYQKKVRMTAVGLFLAAVFLLSGMLLEPMLFPKKPESEVYIPNGKGDILLANISRSQATVIFRTLDAANGSVPLATTAFAEVFEDRDLQKMVRRTQPDSYAVTHIIPVDGLEDGKIYYVRITASDSATPAHKKILASWGDGNDPIRFYATGEIIPACAEALPNAEVKVKTTDVSSNSPVSGVADNAGMASGPQGSTLAIMGVDNENHLFAHSKVQTIVSWTTNLPATSELIYREGNDGQSQQTDLDDEMRTKHAITLTTLKAGTTYYFKVKSVDAAGNSSVSEEYSLRTPKPEETIVQQIADNFKALLHQVKPN